MGVIVRTREVDTTGGRQHLGKTAPFPSFSPARARPRGDSGTEWLDKPQNPRYSLPGCRFTRLQSERAGSL